MHADIIQENNLEHTQSNIKQRWRRGLPTHLNSTPMPVVSRC